MNRINKLHLYFIKMRCLLISKDYQVENHCELEFPSPSHPKSGFFERKEVNLTSWEIFKRKSLQLSEF